MKRKGRVSRRNFMRAAAAAGAAFGGFTILGATAKGQGKTIKVGEQGTVIYCHSLQGIKQFDLLIAWHYPLSKYADVEIARVVIVRVIFFQTTRWIMM